MKEEKLDINTLDRDLYDLKEKYIQAIFDYIQKGINLLKTDNIEVIDNLRFSFEYFYLLEITTKKHGFFEIDLETLEKSETIEIWIETDDSELYLNNENSIKFFQEASYLVNNIQIEFKDDDFFTSLERAVSS